MANDVRIPIKTTFDARGSRAAIAGFKELQQVLGGVSQAAARTNLPAVAAGQERIASASRKAATEQERAAQAAAKVATEQAKATRAAATQERGMLQQAQATARLQSVTQNYAGAQTTLQQALTRTVGTTRTSLSAQTQLAQIQQRAARTAQQDADSVLRLAQAQARAQAAAGQLAAAETTLSGALAKSSASAKVALGAQTQLAQIQSKMSAVKPPDASGWTRWAGMAKGAVVALGGVAIALAGLNSAASALSVAADYESQMAILKANTNAGEDAMRRAGATAKALGADLSLPATSAASAAVTMNELVKGGLNLDQAMAAAKGTLQLAAAGMIAEADAAQIATGAINAFGLSGNDAVMVADQLAAGAAATSTSVKLMGDSLEQGGGIFASYQTRVVGGKEALTQFNTAVGVLATAGVTGQKAGTYIATAMERMARPTEDAKGLMVDLAQKIGLTGDIAYDAQGKMRPFEEIMHNVAAATADMTEQERDATLGTLFMTEGMKAVIPIINSMTGANKDSEIGWDAIKRKTTEVGAAQTQAAAQMAGLNGAVKGLQSQVETLALNAFEPLLPLITEVVNRAAALASSLADNVGPAALALADGIRVVGFAIQDLVIPALIGATAATIAYGIANASTLGPALAKTTVEMVKNAAAAAAVALPYAAIAIAVAGVAYAYKDYQDKLTNANKDMLQGNQFWRDAGQALKDYQAAQDSAAANSQKLPQSMLSAANTVQILQAKVEAATRALAEDVNSGRMKEGTKPYQDRMDAINRLAGGLVDATTNLDNLTQAEVAHAAAGMSASGAAAAQAQGIGQIGEAAKLTMDDLQNLATQLDDIFAQGGDAAGAVIDTQATYIEESQARQEEYATKMAELNAKMAEAKTESARQGVQEEIAALQSGYGQQEAEQASSYARQIAAQNAMLGQMLIAYTSTQVQMGNLTREQGEAVVAGVEETFGIVRDEGTGAFLELAGVIDNVGTTGGASLGSLSSDLAGVRDNAVELRTKFDALVDQYTAQVLVDMQGRPPEEIAAKLASIPAKVYAEVYVTEHYSAATGAGTAGRQEWEKEMRPRRGAGSASAGGGRFLSNGPTTLMVGDNPGGVEMVEVTPLSGKGSTSVGPGLTRMAGGGTVIAGSLPVAAPSGRASRADDPVKAAAKVSKELLDIQRKASEDLVQLQQSTQEKLQAIDAKYSEQTAEKRRALYGDMATDYADMLADMSADDLDFYDKSQDRRQLQQREAAQATYRARVDAAQAEAKEIAKSDAELAKDVLAIREQAAQQRAQLDARYNEVAAQANKKDRSKLKKEYDEAVADQEKATQIKIDLARAESEQRQQAQQDEKTTVVTEAQGQAQEIINQANEQANQVEGATNRQKAAVILSLAEQQNAVGGWSNAFHSATERVISDASRATSAINSIPSPPTSTGGTGSTPPTGSAAAGGGSFVTRGATTLRVGDNPGGRELVTVTPLSGKGSTSVGPGMVRMAGGGSLLAGGGSSSGGGGGMASFDLSAIDPADLEQSLAHLTEISRIVDEAARRNKVDPGPAKKYSETVQIIANALKATVELRQMMRDTGKPIDMTIVQPLIEEATSIGALFVQFNLGKKNNIGLLKEYGEALGAVFDVIHGIIEMRKELKEIPPAVELNILMMLADEAKRVVRVVQQQLVKLFEEEREDLKGVAEALETVVGILTNVIDLRSKMKDLGPPVVLETVQALADEAVSILNLVRDLQGLTLDQADSLKAVAEQTDNAVGILNAMADLRDKLRTPAPPIQADTVAALVQEAVLVRSEVLALLPPTDAAAAGLEAYATSVEQAAGMVQRLAELRGQLVKLAPPLNLAIVDRLATEARRVVERLMRDAIPYAAESVAAMESYGSINEQSVNVLQRMAELAKTLANPVVPIDEELVDYLAAQARRVAIRLYADAIPYSEEGEAGFSRYVSVLQGSVDLLTKVASLGEALRNANPLDEAAVRAWSAKARTVAGIVVDDLLPVTEEQAAAFGRYSEAQGQSVDIVSRTASLGKDLAEAQPFTEAQVRRVAADGKRVLAIVEDEMTPVAEDEAEALKRYADAQGSVASAIKSVLELSASALADYQSPTRAQFQQVIDDGKVFVAMMMQAAATYQSEGVAAGKAFSESVGAAFAAGKAGLEFFDGLRAGTTLDRGALDAFVGDSLVALDKLELVSARAAAIPATNLNAVTAAASALSAQSQALIDMSQIPNSGAGVSLAGLGGGTSITNMLTIEAGAFVIYQQPGESIDALADRVADRITQRYLTRR